MKADPRYFSFIDYPACLSLSNSIYTAAAAALVMGQPSLSTYLIFLLLF